MQTLIDDRGHPPPFYTKPETFDKWLEQLEEGGPTSGWYAPPKGTHGPGAVGYHNLTVEEIEPGEFNLERAQWTEDVEDNWGDDVRESIALDACDQEDQRLYGLFDGDELVGVSSMSDEPNYPSKETGLDYLSVGDGKRYIGFVATKRGGYGEELMMALRQRAAEEGQGVHLYSLAGAMGFYKAVGGAQPYEHSPYFYWEVLQEKKYTKEEIAALEPEDGGFAIKAPFMEGGKGSGWFAPPKGTHGKEESGIRSATWHDEKMLQEWLQEVQQEWPEREHWSEKHRTLIARRAIEKGIIDRGTTTHALFEDGELVAVVNIRDEREGYTSPGDEGYTSYGELDGMREITYMATKRAGYGLKASMMALQQIGPEGAWWYANEESRGFYERMGALTVPGADSQDIIFYIPAGFKELSRKDLESMDLVDFEPEHGVFIATRNPLSEGGDGSGWFAPPKGTHGKRTISYSEQPTTKQMDRWDEQVKGWSNERGGMAVAALHSIRSYGDVAAIYIEEGGELKGIGSISTPEGSRRMNAWRLAPYEPDPVVSASFMATKERGHGLRMMQGLASLCIENDWELRFGAIPTSIGFFRTIGMRPVREDSTAFRLSAEELRAWRQDFSEAAVPSPKIDWVARAAGAEPDNGVFIVTCGSLGEGGDGSGWFAPPKGTHVKQGGSDQERVSSFEATVNEGDVIEERGLMAGITRSRQVEYSNGEDALFKIHTAASHHGGLPQDAYCEQAAHELANLLGEEVVSEIVLGEHGGDFGSFQEWLDGEVGQSVSQEDAQEMFDRPDTQDRLEVIMALDVIMTNNDRHGGNWLLGDDGKVYALDHGFVWWDTLRPGVPEKRLSPVWYGLWNIPPTRVPGVTNEKRGGRWYPVFHFQEETLDRWRGISQEGFNAALEPLVIGAGDRGVYTRVNLKNGWDNFQQLLHYGAVSRAREGLR